jgi:ABC-type multidrug transport system permease subunit
MMRLLSPLNNLARIVVLDFIWSARVPSNLLYQFFVSAIGLLLFAHINDNPAYLPVLVPGLIALVTASNSMQGLGSAVSYMRAYGAWRTVRGSPIPIAMYLAGLIVSRAIRLCLTVLFMVLLARLALGYVMQGSLLLMLLYVLLGVAVFGAIGLTVTHLVPAPQAVSSILSAVFLFMLFSSNTLFIAKVPWLTVLSVISPLTFLSRLLRAHAQGLEPEGSRLLNVGVLVIWLAGASVAALILARRHVEEA